MNTLSQHSAWIPSPSTTRGSSTKLSSSTSSLIAYTCNKVAFVQDLSSSASTLPLSFPSTSNSTVASISPSSQYLAVGESNGTVKIYDLTSETLKTAFEFKSGGKVNDLAWDGESQRIAFVGEGKERYGAIYSLSTGTQVGEVSGHGKAINSVSLKAQRPFRAITSSDDCTTILLNGVPFKFASQQRKHSRFVQSVHYSPDGTMFLSAGSDGQLYLYNGLDGSDILTLIDPALSPPAAHQGTIFSAIFSKDSNSIVTSSADRTTKLWNKEGKLLREWKFGTAGVDSMQIGNTWIGGKIISLSFSGDRNILNPEKDGIESILHGHQFAVTSLVAGTAGTFISGDASGAMLNWKNGVSSKILGTGHSNLVIDIVKTGEKTLSIGMDDSVILIDSTSFSAPYKTDSLPKGLASTDSHCYLLTTKSLTQINTTSLQSSQSINLSFFPTAIAISSSLKIIAIGAEDGKIHLFSLENLQSLEVLERNRSSVTALTVSPDGNILASGETSGKIILIDLKTKEIVQNRFVFHTAKINSLSFSKNGERLLSGSLDSNVMIYSTKTPSRVLSAKGAHVGGVNTVIWDGEERVYSAGADGCIRSWNVQV